VFTLLAISSLAILKKYDFDIRRAASGEAKTEQTTEVTTSGIPEVNGEKTYLFWCANENRSKLYFAWLVNIRMPERKATVCTLPPETLVNYKGSASSIENVLSKTGNEEFTAAVEATFGSGIDGYICSDETDFRMMMNYLGGTEVTVPEQVEYRNEGLTLILSKGKQTLKGDALFKYLCYLDTLGSRGTASQALVMSDILRGVFKPSRAVKTDTIYAKISNTVDTNITIVDFSQAEEAVKILCEYGFESVKTVDTPEELEK
jgi:anionic cell wall polymer biosynthesis LytR-Cps2A-Psr (LCP) family protein